MGMEPSGLGTIRYFSQMNIIPKELTVEQIVYMGWWKGTRKESMLLWKVDYNS